MLHLTRQRGAQAELLVAYRFLEAGLLVSWPLVPCAYDLVVDGGDRLYRVQVKQAHEVQTPTGVSGHWRMRLTKRKTGAVDQPIAVTAVDVVCMVCTPAEILVIPSSACVSQQDGRWLRAQVEVGPLSKYRAFLNQFVLGAGGTDLAPGAPLAPARKPGSWGKQPEPRAPRAPETKPRKVYRRLTPEDVERIRQMPVQWWRSEPGEGRIPVADLARQFDVSPTTLRNLVRNNNRLDLQALARRRGEEPL